MVRWQQQSYLGVLPVEQCSRRMALILSRGVEYEVYFAASVMRHLAPKLTLLVARGDETAAWRVLRTRAVEGFASEQHRAWMDELDERHGDQIRGAFVGF